MCWRATAAFAATRRACCARWTSRRRPWPSPCWKPSTSCATPPSRGRPASSGRIRSGAGCCATNPTTACGRRRCCSTCAMRSAPATSGWHGRAATATSGRRCCRLPLLLMPTAACRSRPVRRTGSRNARARWTRVCAGWTPRRSRCDRGRQHRRGHAPHRKDRSRRAGRVRRPRRRPLSADTRHADHGHSARGGRRRQVHRVLHAPAHRDAPSRPHRPAQRAARRGHQSRPAQDGRSHDHARVLGIDAHRALARRRRSV